MLPLAFFELALIPLSAQGAPTHPGDQKITTIMWCVPLVARARLRCNTAGATRARST